MPRENMQTPPRNVPSRLGVELWTFLLRGDRANQCATLFSDLAFCLVNSFPHYNTELHYVGLITQRSLFVTLLESISKLQVLN